MQKFDREEYKKYSLENKSKLCPGQAFGKIMTQIAKETPMSLFIESAYDIRIMLGCMTDMYCDCSKCKKTSNYLFPKKPKVIQQMKQDLIKRWPSFKEDLCPGSYCLLLINDLCKPIEDKNSIALITTIGTNFALNYCFCDRCEPGVMDIIKDIDVSSKNKKTKKNLEN